MKRMMVLLAAICVAGMVSAVSFGWSAGASILPGTDTAVNFTAGTDFSVALVFNVADLATFKRHDVKLLQVSYQPNSSLNSGGPFLDVRTDGTVYNRQEGGGGTISLDSALRTGENVFGITVDYQESGDSEYPYNLTYKLFLNGTEMGTFTHEKVGGNNDDFKWIRAGDGGTYYYGEGLATAEDIALLPEPTALALLALGVVGLALRRRVA